MQNQNMEASFSTLIMSLGSSTIMILGLAQNPHTGKTEIDLNIAKFNIDLLLMLQDKTKNNLNEDEEKFLKALVTDLQMKYVEAKRLNPLFRLQNCNIKIVEIYRRGFL